MSKSNEASMPNNVHSVPKIAQTRSNPAQQMAEDAEMIDRESYRNRY